jgi:D-glycero-D-manno-heptose 1,7-bisphosphate phosphatase
VTSRERDDAMSAKDAKDAMDALDGQTGPFPVSRTRRGRRALFADRDGTLIHDAHYLRDPALVELLPGAAPFLRAFAEAGWLLVVVTNQSGIAQKIVTEADYQAVRARFEALLADQGVTLDLTKYCPHHPDVTGPCRCRKPGTLMYEEAAAALGIDLASSVYVGGPVAGCRTGDRDGRPGLPRAEPGHAGRGPGARGARGGGRAVARRDRGARPAVTGRASGR